MTTSEFMSLYKECFGPKSPVPVAVRYSDNPLGEEKALSGCMFKQLHRVFSGDTVSYSSVSLSCGGGKFYTGLDKMPDRVPK